MTAKVNILESSQSSALTERLLRRFHDGQNILWISPTRRAATAVRQRLATCLNPLVFSVDELAEEIIVTNDPTAVPLTTTGRRMLLDTVIDQLRSAGELAEFGKVCETRGFLEGIFGLIEELKKLEIWPSRFTRSVECVDSALREKANLCARIYARYQRFLVEHHRFDNEGKIWYAQELLRQGRSRPLENLTQVFVDGFHSFTRSQMEMLSFFRQNVEQITISLLEGEREELFSVPRSTKRWLTQRFEEVTFERVECEQSKPVDLSYLQQKLFDDTECRTKLDEFPTRHRDTEGRATERSLLCLEAPGEIGEARMVARHIKQLLLNGVSPDDILVTVRDLRPYAEVVSEVFTDYGIPVDLEGVTPLIRSPQVTALLKALRLPEENWPFAAVTETLRSTWFRPSWPQVRQNPLMPQQAEALLRLLGEPRDRDAYLKAVNQWALNPPEALEDEQAEESRRRRAHELAKTCGPFLERFFHAWDSMPFNGTLSQHLRAMWKLAEDLGVFRREPENEERPDEVRLHRRLKQELDYLVELDRLATGELEMDRRTFHRRLTALVSEAGHARSRRGSGRIRILSAPIARHLDADYLFLMGLGEKRFPFLAPPSTFFDEQERHSLDLGGVDLMSEEMLLFFQIVTRATKKLVLSFPAVDERGQDMLPGSFLRAVHECFPPGSIPIERRNMLIEGYACDSALSKAEHRVQVGLVLADKSTRKKLPRQNLTHTWNNLLDAANMAEQRFHAPDYTPFDGMLSAPSIIAELETLFGPDRIFSPTALEDYVACPFRFFLGHVMRLDPLEEPREEIQITRRGQAVHRALARLHERLKNEDIHSPDECLDEAVQAEFDEAIKEDIERAPGPATKALWTLEGERLIKVAAKYRQQWETFLKPWKDVGIPPQPHWFEVDFGLPASEEGQIVYDPLVVSCDGIEVKISGRIDRVDVVKRDQETVFWIIDYKTGKSVHYRSSDLLTFQRLQLTLYALAVQEVLLTDEPARPLGMAYWMVGEKGAKVVLPAKRNSVHWLEETKQWESVSEELQRWVVTLIRNIRQGALPLKPRSEHCTELCDYGQICRINQVRSLEKKWTLPLPQVD